jgi:hypothetical protein
MNFIGKSFRPLVRFLLTGVLSLLLVTGSFGFSGSSAGPLLSSQIKNSPAFYQTEALSIAVGFMRRSLDDSTCAVRRSLRHLRSERRDRQLAYENTIIEAIYGRSWISSHQKELRAIHRQIPESEALWLLREGLPAFDRAYGRSWKDAHFVELTREILALLSVTPHEDFKSQILRSVLSDGHLRRLTENQVIPHLKFYVEAARRNPRLGHITIEEIVAEIVRGTLTPGLPRDDQTRVLREIDREGFYYPSEKLEDRAFFQHEQESSYAFRHENRRLLSEGLNLFLFASVPPRDWPGQISRYKEKLINDRKKWRQAAQFLTLPYALSLLISHSSKYMPAVLGIIRQWRYLPSPDFENLLAFHLIQQGLHPREDGAVDMPDLSIDMQLIDMAFKRLDGRRNQGDRPALTAEQKGALRLGIVWCLSRHPLENVKAFLSEEEQAWAGEWARDLIAVSKEQNISLKEWFLVFGTDWGRGGQRPVIDPKTGFPRAINEMITDPFDGENFRWLSRFFKEVTPSFLKSDQVSAEAIEKWYLSELATLGAQSNPSVRDHRPLSHLLQKIMRGLRRQLAESTNIPFAVSLTGIIVILPLVLGTPRGSLFFEALGSFAVSWIPSLLHRRVDWDDTGAARKLIVTSGLIMSGAFCAVWLGEIYFYGHVAYRSLALGRTLLGTGVTIALADLWLKSVTGPWRKRLAREAMQAGWARLVRAGSLEEIRAMDPYTFARKAGGIEILSDDPGMRENPFMVLSHEGWKAVRRIRNGRIPRDVEPNHVYLAGTPEVQGPGYYFNRPSIAASDLGEAAFTLSIVAHEVFESEFDRVGLIDSVYHRMLGHAHYGVLEGEARIATLLGKNEIGDVLFRLTRMFQPVVFSGYAGAYPQKGLGRIFEDIHSLREILWDKKRRAEFHEEAQRQWQTAQTRMAV